MIRHSEKHAADPTVTSRKAPPCMRRGLGVELSDELFARRLAKGPRRRVKGGTRCSKVLFLDVQALDGGKISDCLNTSEEAKAIERAKPIVAKAIGDGRIRKNSLAALAYASTRSAKPVCCHFDSVSGKYLTQIMRLDGTYGTMSLGTGDDELAKDRVRIVVADWLTRGHISPTGKAARVYGAGGLDAEFSSKTSRLEAERWFVGKCRRQGLKATLYTADEVETLELRRTRVDPAEIEAEAKRLAAVPLANSELKIANAARNLGLDRTILDLLVKYERREQSRNSSSPTGSESVPAGLVLGTRSVNGRTASSFRSRARKARKLIPIAGSAWQFKPGPKKLWFEFSPGRFTAVLTIARHTYRWHLAARSGEEADRIAAPVLQARERVGVAAAHWCACERGTRAAAEADDNVLKMQTEYLKALVEAGAESAKDWGELAKVLRELPCAAPLDAVRSDGPKERAESWFVNLLRQHPDRLPRGQTVRKLYEMAAEQFGVSVREAKAALRAAQRRTGNDKWSRNRRPRKSAV
jgi:hypothetical protein